MSVEFFLTQFSRLDWIGLAWFLICWFGYELVVEHGWFGKRTIHAETNKLRLEWARQLEAELYKDERTTPLNKD